MAVGTGLHKSAAAVQSRPKGRRRERTCSRLRGPQCRPIRELAFREDARAHEGHPGEVQGAKRGSPPDCPARPIPPGPVCTMARRYRPHRPHRPHPLAVCEISGEPSALDCQDDRLRGRCGRCGRCCRRFLHTRGSCCSCQIDRFSARRGRAFVESRLSPAGWEDSGHGWVSATAPLAARESLPPRWPPVHCHLDRCEGVCIRGPSRVHLPSFR
jgi:hypothetical protein